MEQKLNHLDDYGQALMVDVGQKTPSERIASAGGRISMRPETFNIILNQAAEKGDVLGAARIAGIMAAKRTPELIPLCHPLLLTNVRVEFTAHRESNEIEAVCTVKTIGPTGVEMEALCGASVALLTIYDMCKAVDRGMEINALCLYEKQGGKSGHYQRAAGETV